MTAKKNCDQYTNHREVILLYKVKSLALNNNQSIKQSKISAAWTGSIQLLSVMGTPKNGKNQIIVEIVVGYCRSWQGLYYNY